MDNDAAGAVDTISPPQQEGSSQQGFADHAASVRADAIAAVKAAVEADEKATAKEDAAVSKQAGKDLAEAKGEKPAKKEKKAAAKEEAEAPAEETEAAAEVPKAKSIADVLAERQEKATAKRAVAEAKAERDKILAEVEQAKAALVAEREAIQREVTQGREFLARLRNDPKNAIREAGWNGDDLILDLARDGTPEGQIARQFRQLKSESDAALKAKEDQISALSKKFDEFLTSEKETKAKAAEEAQRAGVQAAEKQFIDNAFGDKCPTLSKVFKGHERMLISEAHEVAREYRNRTGVQLSPNEVAEYLEFKFSAQFGTQEQASDKKGSGSQLKPRASATVTTESASEKRTSAKPIEAMTEEERREAAKQAVRRAVKEAEEARRSREAE